MAEQVWLWLTVSIVAVAGIGGVWCLMGIAWARRVHRKFMEQINRPWEADIASLRRPDLSDQDFLVLIGLKFPFYARQSQYIIKELDRKNPVYWWRHWNESFALEEEQHAGR